MLRILVATPLYPPESGGPATHAALMVEKLPAEGFEVQVLPFRAVAKYPKIMRHIAYMVALYKKAKNADMLFAEDTLSVGWPLACVSLLRGKPCVVRVPGDQVWEQGRQRFGIQESLDDFPRWSWRWHPWMMLMRALQRMVLARARTIIVPSEYLQNIVRAWGISEQKIVLLYNGIEFPVVYTEKEKPSFPHIVTIARLVPWKGVAGIIEALEGTNWHLSVVGDGPERENLEAHARKMGVHEQVRFYGALAHEDALGVAKTADVFVLNSTYEGLSHTLLEALALGVPVVATDIPGNAEVITSDEVGRLVPINNPTALKTEIESMLADSALRESLSRNGNARAHEFSYSHTIPQLARILSL